MLDHNATEEGVMVRIPKETAAVLDLLPSEDEPHGFFWYVKLPHETLHCRWCRNA